MLNSEAVEGLANSAYGALRVVVALLMSAAVGDLKAQLSYEPGPSALSFSFVAKVTFGATSAIDPSTGVPYIDPSTKKPLPDYKGIGAKTFDRKGRVLTSTDTLAGKIVSERYGNAEFLADLLAAGELPDTGIKGWAIFAIRDDKGSYRVEARKIGKPSVDLQRFFRIEAIPLVSNYNRSLSRTYKNGQLDVATGRGSAATEGIGKVSFGKLSDSPDGDRLKNPEFSLGGSVAITSAEFRWYPDLQDKSVQSHIDLRSSVRFVGMMGAYEPASNDESGILAFLISGSCTLGPEKQILSNR